MIFVKFNEPNLTQNIQSKIISSALWLFLSRNNRIPTQKDIKQRDGVRTKPFFLLWHKIPHHEHTADSGPGQGENDYDELGPDGQDLIQDWNQKTKDWEGDEAVANDAHCLEEWAVLRNCVPFVAEKLAVDTDKETTEPEDKKDIDKVIILILLIGW